MTSAARMAADGISVEDWGPGPPPPPFDLPPPPMPPFMYPVTEDEDYCQSLESHLAVCDTTFPSIKSTSTSSTLAQQPWLSLILAAAGLLFLGLCVTLFLAWRRWRSRNHLSYLRAKSHYDSQPEASEHPLIYDDANIHFYRTSHNNAYLLEPGSLRQQQQPRSMVRDTSGLSQQSSETRLLYNFSQLDNESRIYEEVFLAEDPYCHNNGGGGHYARPVVEPPSCQMLTPHSNEVDSDQWPNGSMQYSAVYVPPSAPLMSNLAESSFSSTSDQAHQRALSGHSSSLSAYSGGTGGKSTAPRKCRRNRLPASQSTTVSSSCSCSSCSSCPEDNTSLMPQHRSTKENGKCSPLKHPLSSEDLLWQGGAMQNNLPSSASGGGCWGMPAIPNAAAAQLQSRQSWHKNVVVCQQQEQTRGHDQEEQQQERGGIFSSLWRKRSRTAQNANNKRNLAMHPPQQPLASTAAAASAVMTGNQQHAWMTLRVPLQGHVEDMHQQRPRSLRPPRFPQAPQALQSQQRPQYLMQSKTLDRQASNNGHVVMPNPDDILPKEAWTDFSGNDEWPRFSGIQQTSDQRSQPPSSSSNNNRLYVNCPSSSSDSRPDSKDSNGNDEEEDDGRSSCALKRGCRGVPPPRRPPADSNDNGLHDANEKFSQQIENNLMASATPEHQERHGVGSKKSRQGQDKRLEEEDDQPLAEIVRSSPLVVPPVPPPRNCISHQRKHRTKQQQSTGNGEEAGRGHANDERSEGEDEEEEEKSLLLLDHHHHLLEAALSNESSEWHQSPLLPP